MALTGYLNRLKFWKRSVVDQHNSRNEYFNFSEHRIASKLKPYENYISEIENIIMWEKPANSVLCILIVNVLFWMLVSLEWRFFGIVSTVMLVFTIHDAWTNHVWPEISVQKSSTPPADLGPVSPRVEAVSKQISSLYTKLKQCALWIRNTRTQQPGLFCCGSVLGSSSLFLLARSVSGLVLVYSLIMAALLGPGLVTRCVSPSLRQTITQHLNCISQAFINFGVNDSSDDEYLPHTTSEDLALLTRVSDLAHDTCDSITNPGSSSDLVPGLAMMPSHEEDSLATISELEYGLSLPPDIDDDSDSNPDAHQMQFQSGHFNGDSSSDEEPFSKELLFGDNDEGESVATRGLSTLIAQAVTRNLANSVGVLAGVLRPPTRDVMRRRQETDSDLDDFEVINRDELGS